MQKDSILETNLIGISSGSTKLQALMDILMVFLPYGAILYARYIFDQEWIGLIGTFAMIGWLLWVMRRRGDQWQDIGMARPASIPKTVLSGVLILIVSIIVPRIILEFLTNLLNLPETDVSRFANLPGNLSVLLYWVFRSWTTIAFSEEMISRGFMINRLGVLIGNVRYQGVLAAVVSSVIFGFAHFYLGWRGIFSTGLIGLTFALSYLLTRRNLWALIFAHGLGDTIGMFMIYLGLVDLVA